MVNDAGLVSHFENGLNNVDTESMYASLPIPTSKNFAHFKEEFHRYTAGDYVITETGTGTRALANEINGVLVITNAAADNDANFFQWAGGAGAVKEQWKFVSGKELFFEARFKVSDITESDFIFGLQITDTTPLAVTDGVYFRKDDGDSNLDFVVIKNSTATTTTIASQLANDTYVNLGFHYNGSDAITIWKNGTLIGTSVTTNLVDDEELAISFGIQNGEAVAKVMSVDGYEIYSER